MVGNAKKKKKFKEQMVITAKRTIKNENKLTNFFLSLLGLLWSLLIKHNNIISII
jgi:hypothetical protein